MDGYVASARIVRATPRLAGGVRRAAEAPTVSPATTQALVVESDRVVGHGPSRLAERRSAFRERCSQLTFYLLSPNSWR